MFELVPRHADEVFDWRSLLMWFCTEYGVWRSALTMPNSIDEAQPFRIRSGSEFSRRDLLGCERLGNRYFRL